ncbi:MAG: histidine triad nucleotide-binding protein [Oscillospiraceae bacterium]|nr:histidine triad nucleotide-binding protein [Oscillospiraceae bacterium]
MDCLFCKIANNEIPSDKVYEDNDILAFRDIKPNAPTHILIIPKAHIASAAEITAENSGVISKIFEAAAKIAKDAGLESGFRVVTNCGESAGQSVMHLHFHLMGGRSFSWPPG